ncbi:hypothetical protein OAT97_00195 [Gammaproteobacteria bacterium]|nr:hypothetical protein [Gammaproteobacteria bacterium]
MGMTEKNIEMTERNMGIAVITTPTTIPNSPPVEGCPPGRGGLTKKQLKPVIYQLKTCHCERSEAIYTKSNITTTQIVNTQQHNKCNIFVIYSLLNNTNYKKTNKKLLKNNKKYNSIHTRKKHYSQHSL